MYFLQNFHFSEDVKSLCVNADSCISFENNIITIPSLKTLYLDTYFNTFSLGKWNKYTLIDDLYLSVSGEGKIVIEVKYIKHDNFHNVSQIIKTKNIEVNLSDSNDIFIAQSTDAEFVHINISAITDVLLHNIQWKTSTDLKNKIKLNLATVSFNKEKYLFRNLDKISKTLKNFKYKDNINISIIDTGNSLKKEDVEKSKNIKLYPTSNDYGASGGFSRAALEALNTDITHVIFMDDDIEITEESIIRPYMFLSYMKPEFLYEYGIAGSMFMLENKHVQHVQAGCLTDGGLVGTMPNDMDMTNIHNVIANESKRNSSADKLFSGFWFTVFPISLVKKNGLMLPCFIKCDDIDFGVNTVKGKFITLNGIAVWHEDFYSKENAIFNVYYDMRNLLMTFAINNDSISSKTFFKYFMSRFYNEIKLFRYHHAQALLLALDDFSKGLSYIEKIDNKNKIKEIYENNFIYKAEPIENFDFIVDYNELIVTRNGFHMTKLKKLIRKLTFNGYLFPEALCFERPKPLHYVVSNSQYAYRAKKLLHIDSRSETGYLVERDVKLALKLVVDANKKIKKIKNNLINLCDDYRLKGSSSRSIEVWKERLLINEK